MAIGKNRGSQVMAIGKKIVRGSIGVTGRIFHRRNERLKRLSTTMNKESTTTRWDNAVDVIDELLADERRLTPQQRQGLRGVQELLIMGVQDENVYHIPMCLLDASRNDTADNEQDMEKNHYSLSNKILAQFNASICIAKWSFAEINIHFTGDTGFMRANHHLTSQMHGHQHTKEQPKIWNLLSFLYHLTSFRNLRSGLKKGVLVVLVLVVFRTRR